MTDLSPERRQLLIWTLSAANFTIGMGAFVVIGVLTPISQGLSMTKAEAGFVLTSYAIAYAILSPLLVALTGSWSRRSVLTLGMSLFGLAAALSALATSPALLYAARILAAAGGGMFTPVVASVAYSISAPENRGKALANVFFGLTLAQAVGVPIGSWLGYRFGWQAAFITVAVLALASVLMCRALVPRSIRFQVNNLETLAEALLDWRSMLSVLFTGTFLGAIYILFTYLAPLLEDRQGLARDGVSLFLFVLGLGAMAGNTLGGRLNDKIGAKATLILLCCAQMALLPIFSFLPLPVIALGLAAFIWSTFGWSFMAAQQTRLIAQTPQRQSVVLALNAAAIYVGASAGSAIGAVIINRYGIATLGLAASVAMLLALAHLLVSERLAPKRVGVRA